MNESGIKSHVFRHLQRFQTRGEAVERLPVGDFSVPQESVSMIEWHYSLAACSEGEIDKLRASKTKQVYKLLAGHMCLCTREKAASEFSVCRDSVRYCVCTTHL